MKVNIQKIAYRAIPVLTAFVVLLSCVVVGDPLRANALDLSGRYDEDAYIIRDAPAITLHPDTGLDLYVGDALIDRYPLGSPFSLNFNSSFSAFLGFRDRIRRTDVGNTLEFYGLDYSIWFESESGGGIVDVTIDYINLEFFTADSEYISNTSINRSDGGYKGTIYWPGNSAYFTLSIGLYFDCSNAYGYGYFDFNFSDDHAERPYLLSYNLGQNSSISYSWGVGDDQRTQMNFNVKTGSSDGIWYTVKRFHGLEQSEEFIYDEDGDLPFVDNDIFYIFYQCPVKFDLFKLRPSQMVMHFWLGGAPYDMSVDMDFLVAGFVVGYFDSDGNYLSEQRFGCDLCKDTGDVFSCPLHTAMVDFNIPSATRYLMFGVSMAYRCYGDSTFAFSLNRFDLSVRRVDSGFKSLCEKNGILYLTPEELDALDQLGNALDAVLPDDHPFLDGGAMEDITDADGLRSYTSCISAIWRNSLVVSMLTSVVTLAIVSYIFFGKKG